MSNVIKRVRLCTLHTDRKFEKFIRRASENLSHQYNKNKGSYQDKRIQVFGNSRFRDSYVSPGTGTPQTWYFLLRRHIWRMVSLHQTTFIYVCMGVCVDAYRHTISLFPTHHWGKPPNSFRKTFLHEDFLLVLSRSVFVINSYSTHQTAATTHPPLLLCSVLYLPSNLTKPNKSLDRYQEITMSYFKSHPSPSHTPISLGQVPPLSNLLRFVLYLY